LPFHACAAPTALGALWLSRHHGDDVFSAEKLASRLGDLPIQVTRWPESQLQLLSDMGIRNVRDCLRLPRDGFGRRLGQRYLRDLDYAFGKRIDLRPCFETPHQLIRKIEFAEETANLEVLRNVAGDIVEHFATQLRSYQQQAQSFGVFFHHHKCAPTYTELLLISPAHEKHRILEPLAARLERVDLPAPVTALEMRAEQLQAMEIQMNQLFQGVDAETDSFELQMLVERLRGRFGESGVYGLKLMPEHRPELVWVKLTDRLLHDSSETSPVSPWADERPLWMLPAPVPLDDGVMRFQYGGPLRFESEPERIESGWWDNRDIRRDYYSALTACGEKLWVYRDCLTRQWYLHGIFG